MDFTIIPLLYKSYIYLLSQTCKPSVTGQFFDSGLRLGKGKSHTPDNFTCSTFSLAEKKVHPLLEFSFLKSITVPKEKRFVKNVNFLEELRHIRRYHQAHFLRYL